MRRPRSVGDPVAGDRVAQLRDRSRTRDVGHR